MEENGPTHPKTRLGIFGDGRHTGRRRPRLLVEALHRPVEKRPQCANSQPAHDILRRPPGEEMQQRLEDYLYCSTKDEDGHGQTGVEVVRVTVLLNEEDEDNGRTELPG